MIATIGVAVAEMGHARRAILPQTDAKLRQETSLLSQSIRLFGATQSL